MGDAPELLLFTNPEAFMAVVNNHDEAERAQVLSTLDDKVTCEALRHVIFDDQRALPHPIKFYDEIFMQPRSTGEGKFIVMSPCRTAVGRLDGGVHSLHLCFSIQILELFQPLRPA
jgi:hypothetical protein